MKLLSVVLMLIGSVVVSKWVVRECPTWTLEDDYNKSAAVFVGRAVAQSVTTTPQGRATETTFEIERVWKGEFEKTVQIQTCGGTIGDEAITCGESFTFVAGSRYVVFASGRPLTTNTCRHTAVADAAAETLRFLSNKKSKKAA